jgi:hypothetical protein
MTTMNANPAHAARNSNATQNVHFESVLQMANDPGIVGNLTPDALMFYCQSRLRGLDDQIAASMSRQKKSNADVSALNKLHEVINRDGKAGENIDLSKMDAAYAEAISVVGADSDLGKSLAKDRADILHCGSDNALSDTEVKAMLNNIETATKDINSGSELQMINLQSLMSQRQSAVQLTTNLVQSLGDQMNKIAANIGH